MLRFVSLAVEARRKSQSWATPGAGCNQTPGDHELQQAVRLPAVHARSVGGPALSSDNAAVRRRRSRQRP
eukprot:6827995-Pyramimonas_sp.AAC.1